eukprot:scaffold4840_cov115-Isochrysis_galbana.AAC.14
MPRTIGRSEASFGAKPVATTASARHSEPTEMGAPFRKAPPPAMAEKMSGAPPRSGSTMTPHSMRQIPADVRWATPMETPTRGRAWGGKEGEARPCQ